MRWDALFSDLEAQADVLDQAERAAEVEERARSEVGALGLGDRLRAAVGAEVRVQCLGALSIRGVLRRVGPDWALFDEGAGREAVVVLASAQGISGLSRLSAAPESVSVVESRLDLRLLLRGVARDRSHVRITRIDGSTLDATIDRVGSDFFEVALHQAGETRRRSAVTEVVVIPFAALAVLRRDV